MDWIDSTGPVRPLADLEEELLRERHPEVRTMRYHRHGFEELPQDPRDQRRPVCRTCWMPKAARVHR